jgi:hypothetical protein
MRERGSSLPAHLCACLLLPGRRKARATSRAFTQGTTGAVDWRSGAAQ